MPEPRVWHAGVRRTADLCAYRGRLTLYTPEFGGRPTCAPTWVDLDLDHDLTFYICELTVIGFVGRFRNPLDAPDRIYHCIVRL